MYQSIIPTAISESLPILFEQEATSDDFVQVEPERIYFALLINRFNKEKIKGTLTLSGLQYVLYGLPPEIRDHIASFFSDSVQNDYYLWATILKRYSPPTKMIGPHACPPKLHYSSTQITIYCDTPRGCSIKQLLTGSQHNVHLSQFHYLKPHLELPWHYLNNASQEHFNLKKNESPLFLLQQTDHLISGDGATKCIYRWKQNATILQCMRLFKLSLADAIILFTYKTKDFGSSNVKKMYHSVFEKIRTFYDILRSKSFS